MSNPITRRALLRNGLVAGAGIAALPSAFNLLDGTAWAGVAAAKKKEDYGDISFQLSWVPTAQFAGTYVAIDKGFYAKQGFGEVTLLPGGPNVTAEPSLGSGEAFAAVSSAIGAGVFELSNGPKLQLIGVVPQLFTVGVLSLAKNPIKTPKDMEGKKIGAQPIYGAFWADIMKAIGADAGKIDVVPVQYDPSPLVNGEVDGFIATVYGEPSSLKAKGIKTAFMNWADYGLNSLVDAYAVTEETLQKEPEKVKAFLTAEIQGMRANMANPKLGAKLTTDVYAKNLGLDPKAMLIENKGLIKAVQSDTTAQNGLFWMSDELIEASNGMAAIFGLPPTRSSIFTNEVLAEIYKENPALKTIPAT